MPEIAVGAQVFDVVFHPNRPIVYTGLLTGHIKAFSYNEQGSPLPVFSLRPSKKSCRGLSLNTDGTKLYAVGKAKSLNIIDTATQSIDTRTGAHDVAINRVKSLMPWMVATGDDDGTVKLWDPRQREVAKSYAQHFDYISDFLWLPDKKQLVSTSGDGTLSVMDIRSKKPEPIAHSEDQEDELLSIVAIKGSTKILVGTQIGVISIFNRNKGWADCVDRIPGHPLSVDALCNVPAGVPDVDTDSTVLTGSSDGFVRAVQILPTKLVGVVADHGEFPVERIAVGEAVGQPDEMESEEGSAKRDTKVKPAVNADEDAEMEEELSREKKWWVGSVGHDDTLRMTDLEGFFRENTGEGSQAALDADEDEDSDWEDDDMDSDTNEKVQKLGGCKAEDIEDDSPSDDDDDEDDDKDGKGEDEDKEREQEEEDDSDEEEVQSKSHKRKRVEKDSIAKSKKGKKAKNEAVVEKGFFDGL